MGIVVSWIVPVIVIVAVVTVVLVRRWIPAYMTAHSDRRPSLERRTLMTFVAADSVGALFALGATTLLPVLVVGAVGPTMGAYFAITWTIITALTLVPINLAASLTVESVHTGDALGPQLRRTTRHLYLLLVPLVVGVIVFAEWGLHIFGAAYSENATLALRIGAVGLLPFAANHPVPRDGPHPGAVAGHRRGPGHHRTADARRQRPAAGTDGHRGRDVRLARRPVARGTGRRADPAVAAHARGTVAVARH